MSKRGKIILWVVVILIVLLVLGKYIKDSNSFSKNDNPIKIGIVTDITGGAAYWGESTLAGIEVLKNELGPNSSVQFIVEDYGLEAPKGASAAQKLLNVDRVDAMYTEFNPGAVSVASVLKNSNTPLIYNAAIVSPLKDSELFYKTYLDYEAGCRTIAKEFQNQGIEKIGFLKVTQEFGELCENGLKEVYGENLMSEGYNLGDTNFKSHILKMKEFGAGAVVNVGFEGDTVNTLKAIRELKADMLYGTVDDTVNENVIKDYGNELKGGYAFGFVDVSGDLKEKLKDYNLASDYGAALSYTHLKQLVTALQKCPNKEAECIKNSLNKSTPNPAIGFNKFEDRIADLDMKLKKY